MKNILLLGIGNMGGAIAHTLLKVRDDQDKNCFTLFAVDPAIAPTTHTKIAMNDRDITVFPSIADASTEINIEIDIIILAIKPQHLDEALRSLSPHLNANTLIISTVAGIPIAYIQNALAKDNTPLHIARIMPTIATLLQESLTGVCFSSTLEEEDKQQVLDIIQAMGTVIVLPESQMSAITGMSGSGIAFVAEFIATLTMAGVKEGIAYPNAYVAALQTVRGALALLSTDGSACNNTKTSDLKQNADVHSENNANAPLYKSPQDLITAICSPGGTTITGIQTLHEHGMQASIFAAVNAATKKSEKFCSQFLIK